MACSPRAGAIILSAILVGLAGVLAGTVSPAAAATHASREAQIHTEVSAISTEIDAQMSRHFSAAQKARFKGGPLQSSRTMSRAKFEAEMASGLAGSSGRQRFRETAAAMNKVGAGAGALAGAGVGAGAGEGAGGGKATAAGSLSGKSRRLLTRRLATKRLLEHFSDDDKEANKRRDFDGRIQTMKLKDGAQYLMRETGVAGGGVPLLEEEAREKVAKYRKSESSAVLKTSIKAVPLAQTSVAGDGAPAQHDVDGPPDRDMENPRSTSEGGF